MGGRGAENSSSALLGVVEQAGVIPLKGVSIYLRKRLIFSVHFDTHSHRRSRLGLSCGGGGSCHFWDPASPDTL